VSRNPRLESVAPRPCAHIDFRDSTTASDRSLPKTRDVFSSLAVPERKFV
jgi:hypothetical protein